MSGTPAPSQSTPPRARTPAERLKALADLQATARERLDRSPGFLASLDDAAIDAYLQSDQPEVLGSWPPKKTEK